MKKTLSNRKNKGFEYESLWHLGFGGLPSNLQSLFRMQVTPCRLGRRIRQLHGVPSSPTINRELQEEKKKN